MSLSSNHMSLNPSSPEKLPVTEENEAAERQRVQEETRLALAKLRETLEQVQ